jgi:hypothetical protein
MNAGMEWTGHERLRGWKAGMIGRMLAIRSNPRGQAQDGSGHGETQGFAHRKRVRGGRRSRPWSRRARLPHCVGDT